MSAGCCMPDRLMAQTVLHDCMYMCEVIELLNYMNIERVSTILTVKQIHIYACSSMNDINLSVVSV